MKHVTGKPTWVLLAGDEAKAASEELLEIWPQAKYVFAPEDGGFDGLDVETQFDDSLLWGGIPAVLAGRRLLERRAPIAVNVLLVRHDPKVVAQATHLLKSNGYRFEHDWRLGVPREDLIRSMVKDCIYIRDQEWRRQ